MDRLRAQLKNLCPGNLYKVTIIAKGTAIKAEMKPVAIDRIKVFLNKEKRYLEDKNCVSIS